jgi:ABC-2 type transport system ATP-binding protein
MTALQKPASVTTGAGPSINDVTGSVVLKQRPNGGLLDRDRRVGALIVGIGPQLISLAYRDRAQCPRTLRRSSVQKLAERRTMGRNRLVIADSTGTQDRVTPQTQQVITLIHENDVATARRREQRTPPSTSMESCPPADCVGCAVRGTWAGESRLASPAVALILVRRNAGRDAVSALKTVGLTKDYGAGRGVFDLDIEVHAGEVFGFLGPNGAGKSTTIKMLIGQLRPTNGSASVLGFDTVTQTLEVHRHVGYLPADIALYKTLSGREMLRYLASLRGPARLQAIDELSSRFEAELDRPIRTLSTGNRQKLGLIQALMHDPEILILDEPISGLDPLVQRSFHELLLERAAAGRTVFLSSHTLSEVERVTDRVAVLREGRLVVVDSVDNLRNVAVQSLDIEFKTPVDAAEFVALPGVTQVQAAGTTLTVSFEGDADSVIKAAARHQVRSIRPREDDLEAIFLRYYQDPQA